jgi:hypothetical protein
VHPVHAAVGSWRDFFIHIAIIVVGLCIAVGLEQTVEFVHHRHQRTELRRALRLEREENYKTLTEQTVAWRWETAELQNNLLVFQYLQQHPGTPQEKLPGVLLWRYSGLPFSSAVWDAAHQSGVLALMPREEIEETSSLYGFLNRAYDAVFEIARAIEEAQRYNLLDSDPSHLDASQIAAEIVLTQTALTAQLSLGWALCNLRESAPDFPSTVTREELHEVRHIPDQQTGELLDPARALTMERLRAAGYIDQSSPTTK